ncbi:MAG TPA: hypothetical protein VGO62_17845, partial [Myxococcota bacterium]
MLRSTFTRLSWTALLAAIIGSALAACGAADDAALASGDDDVAAQAITAIDISGISLDTSTSTLNIVASQYGCTATVSSSG